MGAFPAATFNTAQIITKEKEKQKENKLTNWTKQFFFFRKIINKFETDSNRLDRVRGCVVRNKGFT